MTGKRIMSLKSRQELTTSFLEEYKKASKSLRSTLLDSLCRACQYNRKYAIRLIQGGKPPVKKHFSNRTGRPPEYNDPQIKMFLIDLKRRTNLICGKRLKETIPFWIEHFDSFKLKTSVKTKLLKMSSATIDRILRKSNFGYEKIGLCTTKPGSILKKQIKINTAQWEESRPGFIECDTVAHCGGSLSGNFIYSVNAVDIATLWIETRAIWNKSKIETVNAIKSIENALPFRLLGFDSDNGSEFINWHLKDYFDKRRKNRKIIFTRSREYHKNDNAHIEGRNWTHVRQYLGYNRFDDIRIVKLLNNLYQNEWSLFFNFFIPSQKCISKLRIGPKIKKVFDKPKTPYQRVMESYQVDEKIKIKLNVTYENLNPYELQKNLFDKIKIIKQISMENVFEIAQ
jgi:hypothetical protein